MGDVVPEEEVARRRLRDALLISLTFAAGVVDALSFLGLGEIFTANMTGNTIFLAIAVGQGHLPTALHSLVALAGFCLAAFLAGRALGPSTATEFWPATVTRLLAAELACTCGFALLWTAVQGDPAGDVVYLLILLSSFGMGLQAACARHLAVPGMMTTVITTLLTGLMAELAGLGVSGPDERRWGLTVVALFAGGALGGATMIYARVLTPFLTVVALAIVCCLAFRYLPGAPPGGAEESGRHSGTKRPVG